jgi:hypothetical protein
MNQSPEEGKAVYIQGFCDTLQTMCIKVIYAVIAGDLNARASSNPVSNAVGTERECRILKIQIKKELDLKRRMILEQPKHFFEI